MTGTVNVAHKDLTGADLHEPKGVANASAGSYYRADGLGSGVWTPLVLPTGSFTVSGTSFSSTGSWTKSANSFAVRICAIGAGGSAYGTSQHDGKSTTVSDHAGNVLITANGGQSPSTVVTPGVGGTGGFGYIVIEGQPGSPGGLGNDANLSFLASWGNSGGPFGSISDPVNHYGRGGSPDNTALPTTVGGGGGEYVEKWFNSTSLTSPFSVTIGTGGLTNIAGASADGTDGFVYIEEYILV